MRCVIINAGACIFQFSILNSQLIITFAADNVERFADLRVPDSLQPHKKMLKVNHL